MLKKISNSKADLFVSNPLRFKDTTGKLIGIKDTVVFEQEDMHTIAKKFWEKILPELVLMLNDSTRDWAANL